ncbi:hypothetical protein QNH39_13200 [Neobacillus novalis]|uniref:Uncharacterized protein n=1 Tax=Neobacillus novalis TaxID=220687 RepID=A0AA95MYY9_9BACI|nr:hypothetical protein [Neobacillus novalis]WHY88728.1 hypothetical protein QNH39_13200 [Neobacillus novalis]
MKFKSIFKNEKLQTVALGIAVVLMLSVYAFMFVDTLFGKPDPAMEESLKRQKQIVETVKQLQKLPKE